MILTAAYDNVQVSVPTSAHTLDGFRRWASSSEFPERGRFTLFNGEVFADMFPERIGTHNRVKAEISFELELLNRQLDLGELYPDGLWLTNDEAGLSTEADATFVTWESLENGRGEFVPMTDVDDSIEMRGSPDWVLEVVSRSSVHKDRVTLVEAYFLAGIREYWLVDARDEDIHFTIYQRGTEQFVPADSIDGWIVSAVFQREFRLESTTNRVGGDAYSLHVRES